MEIDVRIQLGAIWIALMLVYLLGDVLRIFSGDYTSGKISGTPATQAMWLGAALIMLVPIVMILLSVFLDYSVNRWANIIAAGSLFVFNLVSLPGYPSAYDRFLLAVSLVFNGMTIWLAWYWSG